LSIVSRDISPAASPSFPATNDGLPSLSATSFLKHPKMYVHAASVKSASFERAFSTCSAMMKGPMVSSLTHVSPSSSLRYAPVYVAAKTRLALRAGTKCINEGSFSSSDCMIAVCSP